MQTFKAAVGTFEFSDSDQHRISMAQVPYKYVTIQNRTYDNENNATSGNSILIGSRETKGGLLLAVGDSQLFYEISLCELYVQQLGTAGKIVVGYYAYGRLSDQ